MRPVPLGRKNWLFAGSDAGGERAAAIYSLAETAKLIIPSNGSMNCYRGTSPRSGQGWISGMLPEEECNQVRNRLQAVLTGRLRHQSSRTRINLPLVTCSATRLS